MRQNKESQYDLNSADSKNCTEFTPCTVTYKERHDNKLTGMNVYITQANENGRGYILDIFHSLSLVKRHEVWKADPAFVIR